MLPVLCRFICIAVLFTLGLSGNALNGQETVNIGSRLELFVDRHIIETMDSTELKLHHPRPEEIVLKFDSPWEGAFCGYATVIKADDLYRLYYRGLPKVRRDGTDSEVTCYAESRDGVNWKKPDLGIYERDGSRANNIVLQGHTPASHNFSPFVDSNPKSNEEHRFKALGGTSKGLIAFVSADGKRWKRLQQEPVFTQGIFDSQNLAFWSIPEQQYVCYFRTWTETNYGGFRTISRTTSQDFIHWTDPVAMTFGDTRYEHLYTNQTNPYFRAPHIYLAVAARFMPGRRVLTPEDAKRIQVDPGYFGDCSDAVLLSSRGGSRYTRTFMESFIRPGLGLQHWVSRTNYPALGIVPTGENEISLYLQKNYGQPSAHLQRFSLRTDGFVSVNAKYRGGEMITKPLVFDQEADSIQLHLNLATSAAGSIQVELQDSTGSPLPDFRLEDCETIVGDRIDRIVRWNSKSRLDALKGQRVRVRFVMRDADLYSLQFR